METIKVGSVEDLEVFKRSHKLTLKVYRITHEFPRTEKFGLIPQMRRSVVSIPCNLMDGSHRVNGAEYRHFAGISKGSAGELKYQLLLSKDLGNLSETDYVSLRAEVDEISRMLNGLVTVLSTK
jgi:four helix bundle protein